MSAKIQYTFSGKTWQYKGPNGWHFVSLPKDISMEIRSMFKEEEEGWGRMKAKARIGDSEWQTAIWFDTKSNAYLLPLKAEIRKKEKIDAGQDVHVIINL